MSKFTIVYYGFVIRKNKCVYKKKANNEKTANRQGETAAAAATVECRRSAGTDPQTTHV
jgi:hypothetical protein